MEHKHKALIKQWIKDTTQVVQIKKNNCWVDTASSPLWDPEREYRIKPKDLTLSDYTIDFYKNQDDGRVVFIDSYEDKYGEVHSKRDYRLKSFSSNFLDEEFHHKGLWVRIESDDLSILRKIVVERYGENFEALNVELRCEGVTYRHGDKVFFDSVHGWAKVVKFREFRTIEEAETALGEKVIIKHDGEVRGVTIINEVRWLFNDLFLNGYSTKRMLKEFTFASTGLPVGVRCK